MRPLVRNSLPLLARVDIALRHVAGTADPNASTWARQMLETVVWPAFRELPALHPEFEGAGYRLILNMMGWSATAT